MKGRPAGVLALALLVATPFLVPGVGAATGAPLVDMGYSPSILFPVSQGTPVYTAGEQLWVMSLYPGTATVRVSQASALPVNGSVIVRTVQSGVPVRIATINSTTPQGLWLLQAPNGTASPVPFLVSDAENRPAGLSLGAYRLAKGSLVMNFTTDGSAELYDETACVLGSGGSPAAEIALPSAVGSGSVNITRDGGSLQVEPEGRVGANSSLSVELYRAFTFLSPNSTSIYLSREVRVATTGAVPFTGNPVALDLSSDLPLTRGTYQVRAFFQTASGLFLSSADVLIPGAGPWIWLGGCGSATVRSDSFGLVEPLGADPGAWPRSVWLTYGTFGEEGVANLTLGIRVSEVRFLGARWGATLSNYTIEVRSSSGVQETGVSNGTLFAILDGPSAQVSYAAGLGGRPWFEGTAGPLSPFTSTTVNLNVSKVKVTYEVGGSPRRGGTVGVSDASGPIASARTGSDGVATFYLPSGRYNITASGGGSSAAGSVRALAGEEEDVTLGAQGGAGLESAVLVGLAAAAAVGVGVNLWLWVRERRRATQPVPPKPSQK